jgi:predicted nucleic-acid-binding protein
MSAGCVVDTNIILRWLLQDHPELSQQASHFWAKVQAGEYTAFVPDAVVAEVVFVLKRFYAVEKSEIVQHLSSLLRMRQVTVQDRSVIQQALLIFEKRNIAFVDALVMSYAISRSEEVTTFDAELKKAVKKYRDL